MTAQTTTSQDHHYFLYDERDGHHILFVNDEIMNGPRPFTPLWVGSCRNSETLHALARWLFLRRDRHEEWATLRAELGQSAFERHMASLLETEPLDRIVGTVLQRGDDPLTLHIGELLEGATGLRKVMAGRHSFESNELRERFWSWIHTGENMSVAQALVQLALADQPQELGDLLNELARKAPPLRRARPRSAPRSRRRAA